MIDAARGQAEAVYGDMRGVYDVKRDAEFPGGTTRWIVEFKGGSGLTCAYLDEQADGEILIVNIKTPC